ncbi:translation initiation factor IF-2 [Tindallia magadiensis]
MSKMRVYQLAKELNIENKELINKLQDLNIKVNSHMSTIEEEDAALVIELITDENSSESSAGDNVTEMNCEEKKNLTNLNKNDSTELNSKSGVGSSKEKLKKESNSKTSKEDAQKKLDSQKKGSDTIEIGEKIIVKDFAEKLNKNPNEIIMKLIQKGVMAAINQEIDFDSAHDIAAEYEVELLKIEEKTATDDVADVIIEADNVKDLKPRPPVVTVMGHVDHGKTSLLDAIRKTKVTEREAGGITQHIGASEILIDKKRIVFLDTPGHEAFTAMRARGAKVTDIAILVVAADDGVMPQTLEAINHAKAAQVPIIVAINKIDKPGSNPDRVKQELADQGVLIEEYGGDVICVPVSALHGDNIDGLLEMILLVAEMEELKANPNRKATGIVVEAKLDKGRGAVATVLVQNGTLKIGDSVVIGNTCGRIRAMINDKGKNVKSAKPSTAIEITGLSDVPDAGDQMIAVDNDRIAREIVENRKNKIKEEQLKASQKISLDALYQQMQDGQLKELNIILKADVHGSVEAVKQSLNKLTNEKVAIKTIHGGVGAITETDVMLASASNAIIIGFNVRPTANATALAKKEDVDIRPYRIIYNAIEDIEAAMKGMLDPVYKEEELGKAEVRVVFKVPGSGMVAGCYVIEGKILRNAQIRLVRDGIVIHDGTIQSLKRFKDDVKEVATGYECGIGIENFNDIKENDIIEAYHMKELKQT